MNEEITMNLVRAIEISIKAHAGTRDKVGKPYILHLLAVMLKCKTEKEMIVAILHDVIEDTNIPIDQLNFSHEILDAITAISKEKNEDYFGYIVRCKQNELAKTVKLYDLEHNMSPQRQSCLSLSEQARLMEKYIIAVKILTEE